MTVSVTGRQWVFIMQQLNVYPPSCMEIVINEPRRAARSQAPANLLRLWFPESVVAYDAEDHVLWESTYENLDGSWRYENLAGADMKAGKKIRRALERTATIDALALLRVGVRWEGMDAHLSMEIANTGPLTWDRLTTSTCLQRSAAPDYIDETNTRTFLVSDAGFVASRDLVFPPDRQMIYAFPGQALEMQDGSARTLAEEAMFVVSQDERYVLGYGWEDAGRLFLNRSTCVRCLHSDQVVEQFQPKQWIRRRGLLFLKEGSLEEALAHYRSWKESE